MTATPPACCETGNSCSSKTVAGVCDTCHDGMGTGEVGSACDLTATEKVCCGINLTCTGNKCMCADGTGTASANAPCDHTADVPICCGVGLACADTSGPSTCGECEDGSGSLGAGSTCDVSEGASPRLCCETGLLCNSLNLCAPPPCEDG